MRKLTEDSGVYGYDIVDIGGEGRMLYGLNEYGSPWLAIRSGLTMADQVELPWTTQEIFPMPWKRHVPRVEVLH